MKAVKKIFFNITHFLKNLSFPGFEGYSIYTIAVDIIKNLRYIRMTERAAAISFNVLMGIPPSLIVLASLVPFLPLDNFEQNLLSAAELIAPNDASYNAIAEIIVDFLHTKQRQLLSIGILFAIFYSSNGLMGLMRSFDRSSELYIFRTGLNRRLKAIRLTIILMFMAIFLVALIISKSDAIFYFLNYVPTTFNLIKIASTLLMVGTVYLMICIIYKYGPNLSEKFPFFSPGAVIATILALIVSYVFFFLAYNIINYSKIYGSLGSILMFMAWLFICGLILLIGFEVNFAILLRKIEDDKEDREIAIL